MNTLTFNAGDIIFRQGDFPNTMYNIVKGKVGVYTDYETDDFKELAQLGADEFLGEMGMIEIYPRSATAVALEDGTELEEISEKELNEYFRDKPEKLLKMMRQISSRLRETNKKYLNACRAVFENAEAEANGTEKSEWLKEEIGIICKEYENM